MEAKIQTLSPHAASTRLSESVCLRLQCKASCSSLKVRGVFFWWALLYHSLYCRRKRMQVSLLSPDHYMCRLSQTKANSSCLTHLCKNNHLQMTFNDHKQTKTWKQKEIRHFLVGLFCTEMTKVEEAWRSPESMTSTKSRCWRRDLSLWTLIGRSLWQRTNEMNNTSSALQTCQLLTWVLIKYKKNKQLRDMIQKVYFYHLHSGWDFSWSKLISFSFLEEKTAKICINFPTRMGINSVKEADFTTNIFLMIKIYELYKQ